MGVEQNSLARRTRPFEDANASGQLRVVENLRIGSVEGPGPTTFGGLAAVYPTSDGGLLSSGLSHPNDRPQHSRRCQRETGSANPRGVRPGPDSRSAAALCRRELRFEARSAERVRAGFNHDRSLSVALSVGALPSDTATAWRCNVFRRATGAPPAGYPPELAPPSGDLAAREGREGPGG
jgi:hypothetical protein